jgi:hypothetical protein
MLVGLPEGLALKLHNDLERDRGRYLNTLVLDVTGCDDPALLRELTLTWEQVAESNVHEAWTLAAL